MTEKFAAFAERMAAVDMPPLIQAIFRHHYQLLLDGETGYIFGEEAGAVNTLPDVDQLSDHYADVGVSVLDRTAVLKLNGGLGTSMGMSGPKSLLPVKEHLSFLDIIVKQVQHLRVQHDARLPLVLMNSFNTQAATLDDLAKHVDFAQDIPLDFLQHKAPKIWADSLQPARWPADPAKEWCPPGHGDIYPTLISSGILRQLLDNGYYYIFVSNSDNLGAVLDPKLLGYFAHHELPFMMEVADRTPMDRKGGHLARRPDGQLILRELAQCPPDEESQFQDIERYRYFNTNNLWIDLRALNIVLKQRGGILGLPLIRNRKPIDPTQADSPPVYQLETAMGSAIAVFEGAEAVRVPRSRFVPIKKNNDLLLLWSDVYELTDDYQIRLNPRIIHGPPLVDLDPQYYGLVGDLYQRFPDGAPSLLECRSLRVEGDVRFDKNARLIDDVHIVNPEQEQMYWQA